MYFGGRSLFADFRKKFVERQLHREKGAVREALKRSTASTPGLLASGDLSDAMRLHRQGTERRATITKIRKQFKSLKTIDGTTPSFNRTSFAAVATNAPTFSKNFDSR